MIDDVKKVFQVQGSCERLVKSTDAVQNVIPEHGTNPIAYTTPGGSLEARLKKTSGTRARSCIIFAMPTASVILLATAHTITAIAKTWIWLWWWVVDVVVAAAAAAVVVVVFGVVVMVAVVVVVVVVFGVVVTTTVMSGVVVVAAATVAVQPRKLESPEKDRDEDEDRATAERYRTKKVSGPEQRCTEWWGTVPGWRRVRLIKLKAKRW